MVEMLALRIERAEGDRRAVLEDDDLEPPLRLHAVEKGVDLARALEGIAHQRAVAKFRLVEEGEEIVGVGAHAGAEGERGAFERRRHEGEQSASALREAGRLGAAPLCG